MSTSVDKSSQSLFDSLITELLNSDPEQSLVDICLSGNQKAIAAVPLRYRIIALGFVQKLSLQEVNNKLIENCCEQLYARNLSEATLIYAFSSGLSYEEWKEVAADASSLRDELASNSVLSGRTVSLEDIRKYVLDNSVYEDELAITMHRTRLMQDKLSSDDIEKHKLNDFLLSNIASFCSFREKSRYYFCKYLMYYLEYHKNKYLNTVENNYKDKDLLDELSVFKGITALSRKKHSREAADELITSVGISFGNIYSAFSNFYFEYTSQDWMEVLLEKYNNLDGLSARQKAAMASHIRSYNKNKSHMADDELLEWQQEEIRRKESDPGTEFSYQAGRTGEHFLRKVIRGELDLDRTTLMAFLVFFDCGSAPPKEHHVDEFRLDEVLTECGFAPLDPNNYVDDFFIDYMKAEDPISFLIEEAEIMAMSEENFYLYKTYLNADSADQQWKRLTLQL